MMDIARHAGLSRSPLRHPRRCHLQFRRVLVGFGVGAVLVLGGCRAEESNRPLSFDPGVYKGADDEKLTEAQRKELQERGNLMR